MTSHEYTIINHTKFGFQLWRLLQILRITDMHKASSHSRKWVKSWTQPWLHHPAQSHKVIQEIMGLRCQTKFPLACFPKRVGAPVCSASLIFFKSISLNSWCVLSNYNIRKLPWCCHKREHDVHDVLSIKSHIVALISSEVCSTSSRNKPWTTLTYWIITAQVMLNIIAHCCLFTHWLVMMQHHNLESCLWLHGPVLTIHLDLVGSLIRPEGNPSFSR